MWIFAIAALLFNGFMAWSLYTSVTAGKPIGWHDYASTVLVACGSGSGMVVSSVAIIKAVI